MSRKTVTLDVREDIRQGREPFSKIMQAVAKLGPDQDLELLAPFEPAPLFGVLARQGFSHQARATESGDWEVRFTRQGGAPAATGAPVSRPLSCPGVPVVEVDARGLEPPGPLVKILEAVASLPEGKGLRARTDRRPMHLYAQLDERGFAAETEEQEDGSFVTYVHPR